jgi:hypothetical protein
MLYVSLQNVAPHSSADDITSTWMWICLLTTMCTHHAGIAGLPASVASMAYVLLAAKVLLPGGAPDGPHQEAQLHDMKQYTVHVVVDTGTDLNSKDR